MPRARNNRPVVDREFIYAEMEALVEICRQAGMEPSEICVFVCECCFSLTGTAAPTMGQMMHNIGAAMTRAGSLVDDARRDDDNAGH